jgi:hypothetical protein
MRGSSWFPTSRSCIFRKFGYVTLRGLLTPAEAATLRQEVTGALANAFGASATRPPGAGGSTRPARRRP